MDIMQFPPLYPIPDGIDIPEGFVDEISQESMDNFFEFLQEGLGLDKQKAFAVIWYMQEVMKLRSIPDTLEQCEVCGCMYNTDEEGDHIIDDGDEHFHHSCCGECADEHEKLTITYRDLPECFK